MCLCLVNVCMSQNVNDGTVWSTGVTSPDGSISSNDPATNLFDGSTSTRCSTIAAGTTVRFTPPKTLSWAQSLRIHTGPYSGSVVVRADGSTTTLHANGNQVSSPYWISHSSSSGTLEYIDAQGHIGAGAGYMYAIEIDGVILRDNYFDDPEISMCSTQRRANGQFLIKC